MRSTLNCNPEGALAEPFVREVGTDGVSYIVTPLMWTIPAIKDYYEKFKRFRILSDDTPIDTDVDFLKFVLTSCALWFEVIDEVKGESVGIVYVSNLETVDGRVISANYHVSMWDAKFSGRLPVQKTFVRELFKRLRLEKLEVDIPLFAGGAIRMAKKAGFKEGQVFENAKRYNGVYFNVLHLEMQKDEVP